MAIETEHRLRLGVEIRKQLREFPLDVSFTAAKGCMGILGSSGCGKSMTLKSIAGIVTPDGGRIALQYAQGEAAGGRVLYDSSLRINETPQVRRVGYLFQNYALFPNMTVEENIAAGLKGKGAKAVAGGRRAAARSHTAIRKKVGEMMERFRLTGLEQCLPSRLSGGQQQRVALARILAYEPEVLLLDEPFSAMDTHLKEKLRLELAEVLKDYDGVSILVTHDRDEAYQLCPELLLMDRGQVLVRGKTREIFAEPSICKGARLTGCKNISRIRRVGEYQVCALDWGGIELTVNRPVGDDIAAVGIRAHDFEAVSTEEAAALGYKNCIPVGAPRISEMPFEWHITLENGLWWKREKTIHTHGAAGAVPPYLQVDPSAILLLKGEL